MSSRMTISYYDIILIIICNTNCTAYILQNNVQHQVVCLRQPIAKLCDSMCVCVCVCVCVCHAHGQHEVELST